MKNQFKSMKLELLVSLSLLALTSLSQQISTLSEIYNYEVGDIFHIREWGAGPTGGFEKQISYEITGKYYSPGYDTLFYLRHVKTAESSSIEPDWVFNNFSDTVFYFDLDSLINDGIIDSTYSDSTLYNGRMINDQVIFYENIYQSYQFIVGCGGPYEWFVDFESSIDYSIVLHYFKKGDEEWGEQLMVSTGPLLKINNQIKIYPNPVKSNFNIDLTKINSGNFGGIIYALNGKQLLSFSLCAGQVNSIWVPELSKGIYLLKIQGDLDCQQLIIKQ